MRHWTKADHAMWKALYSDSSLAEPEREARWAVYDAGRQARETQIAFRRVARKHGASAALQTTMYDPQFGPVEQSDLNRIFASAKYAARHAFLAHPELRA